MTASSGPPPFAAPEPILPIRLLALDIDGTLVGDDMVVRDRTLEVIRAAVRRGALVSLATGRMATSARLFADALGLREPIVAYQGALIRAMPEAASGGRGGSRPIGRLLLHRPLPAAVAREALVWCRERGLEPHVNHLERFIVRADDPRADDYSTFLGARANLVEDLVAAIRRPVTKIIAMGEAGVPAAVLGEARSRFAGRAEVTLSHPRFVEFVAPGVSKGRAVAWLARRARVPLPQAFAIGDQWNDLEMIAAVGHGAAMPSAPPEVRLAARYVAPALDAEGAATLIEDLVLAGPRAARRNLARWLEEGACARRAAAAEMGVPRNVVAGLEGCLETMEVERSRETESAPRSGRPEVERLQHGEWAPEVGRAGWIGALRAPGGHAPVVRAGTVWDDSRDARHPRRGTRASATRRTPGR